MRSILLFILIFGLSANSWQGYSQTEDINSGIKVLEDQQFQRAKSIFTSLTEANSADCAALFYLGKTYFLQKQYDSAEYFLKKIGTVNPKSPFAFVGNGIIALRANDSETALDNFKQAKKAAKKDVNVLLLIIDACLDNPKPELNMAESFLLETETLAPQNAGYYICKAKFDYLKGDLGKAASDFEWAYYYDAQNSGAYAKLGKIYSDAQLYRESITALNKSIELEPNRVMVYKYLGDLQYRFGKYSEAKKAYQKYLFVAEVNLDDIEKYAIILFYNKEFKEAADEMQKVMLHDPSNPVMNRITAYVAYETGDYEGGMKYINKLFELKDTSKLFAPDYLYYGKLLLKTGNDSAGIVNIRKALKMDDAKTETYNDLASALSKYKKHDDAIAIYEKLITKGFDKASTYFRIGKEYYYKGSEYKEKYDSAFYKIKLTPENTDSIMNDSINAMESYAKADSFFNLVSEVTPEFYGSYLWRGRVLSLIDNKMEKGLAKEPYEKALSILEKGNGTQNVSSIIECYRYLGAYYYIESENIAPTDKTLSASYKLTAIEIYQKIIALDPTDIKSQEILDQLKKDSDKKG
jgi:pentatricopeptide repeat protein